MKKLSIYYWICTGLVLAGLATGSVFDIMLHPGAVKQYTGLGYPEYLSPFLGVARLLALFAIVFPGYPRVREWAYAGLTFDITGAIYSLVATGHPVTDLIFPLITLLVLAGSYVLYHKRMDGSVAQVRARPLSSGPEEVFSG